MKRFIIIPLLFIAFALSAAPINERQARELATQFFQTSAPTRSATASVELVFAGDNVAANAKRISSVDAESESLIYIYNRSDVKGFVVIAGEDTMRPVIAFSFSNTFNVEKLAVGTRHMLSSWCKQVAAARARQGSKVPYSTTNLLAEIGTPICKYETAEWGQDYPYNALAPVYDGYRCVTGCVATATAIVFRYHQYPQKGVGTTPQYSYEDMNGTTRTIAANTLGTTYNYANMPLSYASGYNSTQAQAVARLMYDIGTAVKMVFDPTGSGAISQDQFYAITTYFGYNKESASLVTPYSVGATNTDNTAWVEALKANLKEYGPTPFGGVSDDGGHAFVLDGVTSSNYFSVNWGWDGHNNGYYLFPEIEFNRFQDAIFGLKPDPTGDSSYKAALSLYPGTAGDVQLMGIRCLYNEFQQGGTYDCIPAIIANFSQADFVGSVVIAHCDKDGKMKRQLAAVAPLPVSIPKGGYLQQLYNTTFQIQDPIEVGDRLRILYWSDSPENAQWARNDTNLEGVIDEIIMRAEPATIADNLSFEYDKSMGSVTFSSKLPLVIYVKEKATNKEVFRSGLCFSQDSGIPVSSFIGKGDYIFQFTCVGAPYELTMTF